MKRCSYLLFAKALALILFNAVGLTAQNKASATVRVPEQVWVDQIAYTDGYNLTRIHGFCNDRQGMVWAVGQRGVARISGALLQYYFPNDSVNQKGLGNGAFYAVVMDAQQRIWVSGSSGLYWFNELRDSFCLVSGPDGHAWQPGARLITLDKRGQSIWMVDPSGLYRYTVENSTWYKTSFGPSIEPIALLVASSGKLLVSADQSSQLYDPATNTISRRYTHSKASFESVDSALWLGTWRDGLKRIDPKTLDVETFFPPGKYKPSIYGEALISLGTFPKLTGDHILWCGSLENGIFFFDISQKKFVGNLNWDERKSSGLPGHSVEKLYHDPSGVLWMVNNGIARITPYRQQLLSAKVPGLKADDSKELYINNLLQDRFRPDFQWLAISYYGLISYNKVKKEVEKWWFYPPGTPVLQREQNYRSRIKYDAKGNLWANSATGFLVINKHQKTQTVTIPKYNNTNSTVNQFVFDKQNTCWMATEIGLCAYDPQKRKLRSYDTGGGAMANTMTDVVVGQEGLWLSSAEGVHFFKFGTTEFSSYRFSATEPSAKAANSFHCIIQNPEGGVFAINDIGLVALRQDELKLICPIPDANFTTTQSMCLDAHGFIWVSAFSRLYKIDPKSGKCIGPFSFTGGHFQEQEETQFKLAGYNTIVTFDPEKLASWTETKKALFTQVKVYDKRLNISFDSAAVQPVRLNYQQNALTFEYDCPDFSSYLETTFEVMLEGYDTTWKPQARKRSITFTNLAPGSYTFHIRASNMAGIKHPETTVLKFVIAPPFWQTWWFKVLVSALVVAALYLAFRARVNAIKKEAARKTEYYRLKAETEMRALRAQMNPHFIFNCMNTIEAFIVEKREDEATAFLQKFSKLIRAVLENAQNDTIPLKLELEVLEWYIQLEQIRANRRWGYTIDLSPETVAESVQIPPLILQPFVENAILHGLYHCKSQDGSLKIRISTMADNLLRIQIEDNGIGRVSAEAKNRNRFHHKQSLGVKFTTDRIRKMNLATQLVYDVYIEDISPDQPGMTGTRVEIVLPKILL